MIKQKARNIKEVATFGTDKALVYIAGKVTGLPYKQVQVKFMKAELLLRECGYEVINPIALVHQEAEWQQAMRICLSFLPHADHIYLLHDWHLSKGAKVERDLALLLGINTIEL